MSREPGIGTSIRAVSRVALLVAILSLAGWARAEAYIDPATGSYVLQMVIAGFLGALLALRLFWHRLVGAISSLFKGSSRSDRDED